MNECSVHWRGRRAGQQPDLAPPPSPLSGDYLLAHPRLTGMAVLQHNQAHLTSQHLKTAIAAHTSHASTPLSAMMQHSALVHPATSAASLVLLLLLLHSALGTGVMLAALRRRQERRSWAGGGRGWCSR
jgi:hypothetical protein